MGIETLIKQSDGVTRISRFKTPRPVAPDPGGTPYPGGTLESRVSWPWASLSVVALLTVMAVAALTVLSRTGLEMAERHGPLIDASMKIKYEISLFHLWFEELVQGDPDVSEEDVWEHLRQAKWYANAMLEGGQKAKGAIPSLASRELRDSIADTLKKMDALDGIGRERLAMSLDGGIGSAGDQRFDAVFFDVLNKADKVEAVLQRTIAASIERFHILRNGILVGLVLFGAAVGFGIFVFQRRHRVVSERLRENEAIRRSEERLRKIFETSPLGVSIVSLETNKRLYINPAMAELFGAESVEQLLEHDLETTYTDPADLKRLRARSGDDFITEIEVERKRLDGSRWWCLLNRRQIEYEGQEALIGWHYDITQRKNAEEEIRRFNEELEQRVEDRTRELQESEALFRAVVDHSPAKIHIKDAEGRYTLINREAEKLFGVTDEEGRGKNSCDLFPKDVADAFTAHDRAVIESGEAREEEEEFMLDDGVHTFLTVKFPIYDLDGVAAVGAIGTDITERKRAEEALQDSEERFRAIFEKSNEPIVLIDTLNGRFVDANEEACKLLQYPHDELLKIDIAAIHPHDLNETKNFFEDVKRYGRQRTDLLSCRTKSGDLVPAEVSASSLDIGGKQRLLVHIHDVTDRKRAEEALRESERRFRAVVDNLPSAIVLKDTEGRYLITNKRFNEWLNPDGQKIVGKTSYDFVPRETADAITAQDLRVLETGEAIERELELPLSDGTVLTTILHEFPILGPDDVPIAVGGITIDITERKRAEEKLKESQARLLEAQSIARLGNWSRKKGRDQVYWSDETYRIFGYEPGEFEPTFSRFKKMIHPQDMKRVIGFQDRAISRKTPYELEYRIVRPDGEIRWVHSRAAAAADGEGKSVEVTGTVQDITDRKEAEEALREKTELVKLLHRVTVSANKAKSVNVAMKTCLKEVCAYMGWPMGHLFILAPDSTETLLPANVWHLKGPRRFDAFLKATQKITLVRGEGLPGRVLASGQPEWLADLSDAMIFLRARVAAKSGIKSGFALPVMIGGEVVAVLEFFSTERVEPDELLLQALVDIGTQLGRVMERKRAEDRLKESEERKGHILRTALDAIITIDDDGRIIEFNPTAEGMFGYTNEEAKGRNAAELIIPPDLRESHLGGMERIKRSGKSRLLGRRIEMRASRADGGEFPAELTVSRFTMAGRNYFTAFIRDISQQKIASENLRKLTQAVEQSPVSVVITDLDATIEYVNPKFVEVTGFSSDEAIGMNPRMLKSGMNPPELYEDLWGTLTSGQEWRGEMCNRKKNGELYWEYAIIAPLKAPGGRVTHYIAVKEDITERKITEETLRQSQKMEALGQLTGGIAHDFNNLLGIIIGHLDLVMHSGIEDTETLQDLKEAEKAALRGASLTQRLLNFSRRSPKTARSININWIIEGMEGMLAKSLTSEIDFIFHLAGNLWPTKIDPTDMENAILNMCINAKDAMPQRGILTIKTENKILDRNDVASEPGLTPGKYALTTVSDTGSGMSPETLKQMFDPFFTTKEQGKGSGLGLSMVYGFIKRSGGHITVESELGKGSTFRMYLPCASAKVEGRSTDGRKKKVTLPGGHETILVVDDEPKLLRSATKTLRTLGYSVLCAENAREALKTLKDNGNIDLLFSDIVMPGGMNGIELAEAARERTPGLKILMTTGFDQGAAKKWRHFDLSENLLQKPYRMIDLATRVRAALDNEG